MLGDRGMSAPDNTGPQDNVVPFSGHDNAFVPVAIPEITSENWQNQFVAVCTAMEIVRKDRAALTRAAKGMAAHKETDLVLSAMQDLSAISSALTAMARILDSAVARLALVSDHEEEWHALQADNETPD